MKRLEDDSGAKADLGQRPLDEGSLALQRPKAGDTSEDLLRFQEEFLASKSRPAASVIKLTDKRKLAEGVPEKDVVRMEGLPSHPPSLEQLVPPKKKSRFRKMKEKKVHFSDDAKEDDPEDLLEKHDKHFTTVLSKIFERDTKDAYVNQPVFSVQGFPTALHRGNISSDHSVRKNKSLFAQQFARTSVSEFGLVPQNVNYSGDTVEEMETNHGKEGSQAAKETSIVGSSLGDKTADSIHQENLTKLSEMGAEQILLEQKKLHQTLDPKIIKLLTTRKCQQFGNTPAPICSAPVYQGVDEPMNSRQEAQPVNFEVPISVEEGWIHMDKVEQEKLAWLKDLPPPLAASSTSRLQARFDFSGSLVTANEDGKFDSSLHHHGNEPERPGYTLEELFHLARSSNIQQRVLALQTLANIIRKAKEGNFEDTLEKPVLPSILEAGIVFLLRWALDDSVNSVLIAAIAALHSLLVNQADESSLDVVLSWYRGQEVACCYVSRGDDDEGESHKSDDDPEKLQKTDADVVKQDVVLGLVTRMNILPRLRYLLEVWQPQAPTVICILEMLTRIARHSMKTAYEIVKCSGLLDVVVRNFLPLTWQKEILCCRPSKSQKVQMDAVSAFLNCFLDAAKPLSVVQGSPLPMALKLMRTIAQAGRNMAALLISKYNIMERILRYMAIQLSELQLPAAEVFHLQTECCYLWKVCLSYGLASHTYVDCYSFLTEKLLAVQRHLQNNIKQQLSRDAALVGIFEAAVHVAACRDERETKFLCSQDDTEVVSGQSEDLAIPVITWSHVSNLIRPISILTQSILNDIMQSYQLKKNDLTLATACINFVASCLTKQIDQPGSDPVGRLQEVEVICNTLVLPCWSAIGFQTIVQRLSQFSNLLSPPKNPKTEIAQSLPDLGCWSPDGEKCLPVVQECTPYGFFLSHLRLIHAVCICHKGLVDQLLAVIRSNQDIVSYMRKMASYQSSHLHSNYFTRFENYVQYYIIKLTALKQTSDMASLHRAALHLLTRLQHGDEHMAHDLLSTVIFNKDFVLDNIEEITTESLANLDITEVECAQAHRGHWAHGAGMKSIRATYIGIFGRKESAVLQSRARCLLVPQEIPCFHIGGRGCLFPKDWMFLPLIELYNCVTARQPDGKDIEALSPGHVAMVTNVLHWICWLEYWRTDVMATISVTLKISRIMCVFLTGNDLFLESPVCSALAALLKQYTRHSTLSGMDFEQPIPGLVSFYDLYMSLLQQFAAVSFGNSLFGSYLLVPLQQQHNIEMRKAVWNEHCNILRLLSVPVHELIVPLNQYLNPDETDPELLWLYFRALMSQTVRPLWSPVMYLVAVHHINRFIYSHDNSSAKLRELMLKQILGHKKQELKRQVLYYKFSNKECEFGMELYTELPAGRQSYLDRFLLTSST